MYYSCAFCVMVVGAVLQWSIDHHTYVKAFDECGKLAKKSEMRVKPFIIECHFPPKSSNFGMIAICKHVNPPV